jgi:hypothetical protein
MDFHSLVATNFAPAQRKPMTEQAETRYYRDHEIRLPRLAPLMSVATAIGLILLLTGVART